MPPKKNIDEESPIKQFALDVLEDEPNKKEITKMLKELAEELF